MMLDLRFAPPWYGVCLRSVERIYCALTLSTLLSSQVSGAHLALAFTAAWGNSSYFSSFGSRCQTESLPCSPRPRPCSGLGGSWHGGTPCPCWLGGFFAPIRPPGGFPGRPCHRQRPMNITVWSGQNQIGPDARACRTGKP